MELVVSGAAAGRRASSQGDAGQGTAGAGAAAADLPSCRRSAFLQAHVGWDRRHWLGCARAVRLQLVAQYFNHPCRRARARCLC